MRPLARWDARIREATRWLAALGLLALFANSLAVVVDIALRAAFSAPIDRLSDVSSVIYYVSAACCLPAATAARRHITIRALDRVLPARGRAAVDAFAAALTATVLGMVGWQVARYSVELAQTGRTLSQIPIRVAPFWYFVSACLAATFAIQCLVAIERLVAAITGVPGLDARIEGESESVL